MHESETSPGTYQHYKGALYRALFTARLSEDRGTEVMVYIPLGHNPDSPYSQGQPWVRPLYKTDEDSWCDIVKWPDGTMGQRFTRIGN